MKIQEIIVILLVGKKISFLVLRNETIILLYFSQPKRLLTSKKNEKTFSNYEKEYLAVLKNDNSMSNNNKNIFTLGSIFLEK